MSTRECRLTAAVHVGAGCEPAVQSCMLNGDAAGRVGAAP